MDAAAVTLFARTPAEEHIYMDLHPCECGAAGAPGVQTLVQVDGRLASRHHGRCDSCNAERDFLFAIPRSPVVADLPLMRFGLRYGRSEIIDPGEWMLVAEHFGRQVPADPAPSPTHREALTNAAAAMAEVLAFVSVPDGVVPESAISSPAGLQLYREDPGRFSKDRIETVIEAYVEMLRDQPAAPGTS